MNYKERYNKLNNRQKAAVEAIDGPVVVLAGPGTGKTELLSMRIANILDKTDVLPNNILCLTFTESGARAMQSRLHDIIGNDAYKVAIHTFHGFGTEVINTYSQYFYDGLNFEAADDLTKYEIIEKIFDELKYDDPLVNKANPQYINDISRTISEIKRAGLTPDEIDKILDANNQSYEELTPLIREIFSPRISNKTISLVEPLLDKLDRTKQEIYKNIFSIDYLVYKSLTRAHDESIEINKAKPITAWKGSWLANDNNKNLIFKSEKTSKILRSVNFIYRRYQEELIKNKKFDFDDMILQVIAAMTKNPDLKYDLQEQYQYILVDEFQDTNLSQMRILYMLADNIANNNKPNILVVGDDDQAIYSFQGAEANYLINFSDTFDDTKIITINDNYRSTSEILNFSRNIIKQGVDRIENTRSDISKELVSHRPSSQKSILINEYGDIDSEYNAVALKVSNLITNNNVNPSDIAIIAKKHKELQKMSVYLNKQNISIDYEKKNNVLELEPIRFIITIANLLCALADNNIDLANSLIYKIVTHPSFKFAPIDIWNVSIDSYHDKKTWFEKMLESNIFIDFSQWLIELSQKVDSTPLEIMLDTIIGSPNSSSKIDLKSKYISPIYQYYFGEKKIDDKPDDYITYLEALRTIRNKLRAYKDDDKKNGFNTLKALCSYVNSMNESEQTIVLNNKEFEKINKKVNLLTAHKSKGLEFNYVFIIDAVDQIWGMKARGKNASISYPENMKIGYDSNSYEEKIRLFFVAATRARDQLEISFSDRNDQEKDTTMVAFLSDSGIQPTIINETFSGEKLEQKVINSWQDNLIESSINTSIKEALALTLSHYKLSITHINNFLNVTKGGPKYFLTSNLLRFPEAMSPSSAYGSAIHQTMQYIHNYYLASGSKPSDADIDANFSYSLKQQRLIPRDLERFLPKGIKALHNFINKNEILFPKQKAELNFSNQNSIINDVHLNGKLDVVDIDDEQNIVITDYKTGKPARSWKGSSDYEKIKLHQYKQQLLFYKLLVDTSKDYSKYNVKKAYLKFIEPDDEMNTYSLETDYTSEDFERFITLVESIWKMIVNLELPDIDKYDKNFKGVIDFENDIIDHKL